MSLQTKRHRTSLDIKHFHLKKAESEIYDLQRALHARMSSLPTLAGITSLSPSCVSQRMRFLSLPAAAIFLSSGENAAQKNSSS